MSDMLNIDNETFANAYECLVAANGMLKEGLGDLSQLDASALELINKEYKDRRGRNKSGERLKDIEDECFDLERRMHDTIVLLAAMESESATYFGGRFSSSLDELGFEDADVFAEWRDVEEQTTVVATYSVVTGAYRVYENIEDGVRMGLTSIFGSEEDKIKTAEEVKRDKASEAYDKLYAMASGVMDIDEDIAYGDVHNISTVAGQIAGNLVINAVGGKFVQAAAGGLQAYGSGSQTALQSGANFDTANEVGAKEGLAAAAVGYGLDVLADGAKTVQTVTDALKTTAKGVGLAVTEPIFASGVEYLEYGQDLVDENGEKLYNSFSEYYTESGGALNTFIAGASTAIRIGGASLKGASASAGSSSSEIPTTKAPDASSAKSPDVSPKGTSASAGSSSSEIPTTKVHDVPSAKTPDTPTKYKYDDLSGTLIPDSEPTKVKPEPVILDHPEAGDNIGVDFGKKGDLDIDTPSKPVIEVDSPPKNVFVDDDGGNYDMDDYTPTKSTDLDTKGKINSEMDSLFESGSYEGTNDARTKMWDDYFKSQYGDIELETGLYAENRVIEARNKAIKYYSDNKPAWMSMDDFNDKLLKADNLAKKYEDLGILPREKFYEIWGTPIGKRPDPQNYLPQEYIDAHFSKFKNGASRLVDEISYQKFVAKDKWNVVGIINDYEVEGIKFESSEFLTISSNLDDAISNARMSSDPYRSIVNDLGLTDYEYENYKNSGVRRYDVTGEKVFELNPRLPSGNEVNAFFMDWVPGGNTLGGTPEIIVDLFELDGIDAYQQIVSF